MQYKKVNTLMESLKTYEYLDKEGHPKGLTKRQYKDVMLGFLEKVIYRMITTGNPIKLPHGLGAVQAVKFKWTKLPIDFGNILKAKREGKTVEKAYRIRNKATNGYWTRIHWHKKALSDRMVRVSCSFKHSSNYCFRLTRPNLRPNSYNKANPKASLYPFFRDKGFQLYQELATSVKY